MSVPPRVFERRAHERARRYIADLLPQAAPAKARYGREALADAILRLCAEGTSAEGVWRLRAAAGNEHGPTGDILHIRTRNLTTVELLDAFNAANARILDYARRVGLLPRTFEAAVDGTRMPYWGKKRDHWVTGGKEDRGTKWAHEYLTVDALAPEARLTLVAGPIHAINPTGVITGLIRSAVDAYRGEMRILYLDRGFFRQQVLRVLSSLGQHYLMPLVKTSALHAQAQAAWRQGERVFTTTLGTTSITVVLADNPSYDPAEAARRGAAYGEPDFLPYVTSLPVKATAGDLGWTQFWHIRYGAEWALVRPRDKEAWLCNRLRAEYRKRTAIETNYRVLKNEFRGRTTTRRASYRLLLFLAGTLLRNLWVVARALADRTAARQEAAAADEKPDAPTVRLTAKVWKDRVLSGQRTHGAGSAAASP